MLRSETFLTVLGGIALTGVLLVLALPLGERAFLAWFALVPLLAAVRGRGFLTGFVAAIASIFLAAKLASTGVFYSAKDFEGEVAWIYTGMGLFGFAVALTVAVWADASLGKKPLWWFAALAVLFESCLLVQLPAHLALTQYRQPVPLLLASVGGIWSVSFVLWLCNVALARMPWRRMGWAALGVALASVALRGAWLPSGTPRVAYGAIQTSLCDSETLSDLHSRISDEGPAMAVWPEFSGVILAAPDTGPLRAISAAGRSAPFVTTFRDDHKPMPHNASALFAHGIESERYFKRKPFGAERKMHAAGTQALAVPLGRFAVGLNICFDSCYPAVMRDTARLPEVAVIALPTIDPRAPHHFMAAMHEAYSPFRAAELGMPIVRADGHAYSSIVDGRGRIVAEAPPGEWILTGTIEAGPRPTVYRWLGDWFLYLCGALFVLGVWRFPGRGRRPGGVAAE